MLRVAFDSCATFMICGQSSETLQPELPTMTVPVWRSAFSIGVRQLPIRADVAGNDKLLLLLDHDHPNLSVSLDFALLGTVYD